MINVPEAVSEGPSQRSFKGWNLDTASKTKNSSYFSKNFFPITEGFLTWTPEVLLGAYMIMHFSWLLSILVRNWSKELSVSLRKT